MEDIVKKRSTAKRWATRAGNQLEKWTSEETRTTAEFEVLKAELERRLASFDAVQNEWEAAADDAAVEADFEASADYRFGLLKQLSAAEALYQSLKTPPVLETLSVGNASPSSGDTASTGSSCDCPTKQPSCAKLPELRLPKFSGDIMHFQSFWDQFEANVDSDASMAEVAKHSYLRSLLEGEAKACLNGLAVTSSNYKVAVKLLRERFGRNERIIFCHLQKLLSLPVPATDPSKLWQLLDELQGHVRSLEVLGVTGEQYGVVLTPIILSRLPEELRMEWSRDGEGKEGDLEFLLEFLRKEISRRERSQTFTKSLAPKTNNSEQKRSRPTVSALVSPAAADTPGCGVCGRTHATDKCWDLTQATIADRRTKIKTAGLCFRCLKKGHRARRCQHRCAICEGAHHSLVCEGTSPTAAAPSAATPDAQIVAVSCTSTTVLQTAIVSVCASDGSTHRVTALLDSGSDRSYVSSTLARRLQPPMVGRQRVCYAPFGSSQAGTPQERELLAVPFVDLNGCKFAINCLNVPTICAALRRQKVDLSCFTPLGEAPLADRYDVTRDLEVSVLLGVDAYWSVMTGRSLRLSGELVAQESRFGWVLSGAVPYPCEEQPSLATLCVEKSPESLIRAMWDLDAIGITRESDSSESLLSSFGATVRNQGQRYEVALPWKAEFPGPLLDNMLLAEGRLLSLQRKLGRDPNLEREYLTVFDEMEAAGMVERVPQLPSDEPARVFYLPHRPVVKNTSTTTKVRPVFDASAAGPNGVSLNDCLEAGPCLLPSLVDVLLRFRRWAVALTADITKAFLQIQVRPPDRDVHRFLRPVGSEVQVWRFTRVPFGNKSSPFLLNATVKHHLGKMPPSRVVTELQENLYVDDWLSGADSDAQAQMMFEEARQIMAIAGLPLVKWQSNSRGLLEVVGESGERLVSEQGRILGVRWSPELDAFSFDGSQIQSDVAPTKRVILSCIMRLYDPIGLMTPFVMAAKLIFQEVWRMGLSWDEFLPEEVAVEFQMWLEGLSVLRSWTIPRRLAPDTPWCGLVNVQLHAFCDASEKAYGAAIYLCHEVDGAKKLSLVASKARVAPLKKVTLPRLELLGALVGCRLLSHVKRALKLPDDTPSFHWTDSMVALGWIQGDPQRWKEFVANRVREIQELSDPASWAHIPGVSNPADLLTRGMKAQLLMSSTLWLNGPDPLLLAKQDSPVDVEAVVLSLNELVVATAPEISDRVICAERFSSWTRVSRVTAWVMRFIQNARMCRAQRVNGELTGEEIHAAEVVLVSQEQMLVFPDECRRLSQGLSVPKSSSIFKLAPFLGGDGLIRVKGRLEFSQLPYEGKYPVVVPKGHVALLLVRAAHFRLKHAGVSSLIADVRASFWVVGLRRLVKRVKLECVRCQRFDALACSRPCAPLPASRVTEAPPFSVTGLDFAGPVYCSNTPGKKYYILLFTCAVIRAVHLELTESLSLDAFLAAFRRFSSRRGLPTVLYSDNARTFKGAEVRLRNLLGVNAPRWRFILPSSPWWGGWWERLVRSAKSALKKSIGRSCVTQTELATVLCEIEACINSRPLVLAGEGTEELALTPAHFLLGKMPSFPVPLQDVPELSLTGSDVRSLQEVQQQLLKGFWKLWSDEYLKNLPHVVAQFRTRGVLRPGSLVLVREDNLPRLQWPLGVVEEVYPGKDGLIRSVRVRLPRGSFLKPIQRLHCLEVPEVSDDLNHSSEEPVVPAAEPTTPAAEAAPRRRSTRAVKQPARLDL